MLNQLLFLQASRSPILQVQFILFKHAFKVIFLSKMIHSYKSKLLIDNKSSCLSKMLGDFFTIRRWTQELIYQLFDLQLTMDDILPILIGSTLTIATYPLTRIGYRITPYFKGVSKLVKSGGYVLVTGATDGIGYQFVKQMTERGVKIIVLGRNQTKLDKIKQNNGVVATQSIDFSQMEMDDLKSQVFAQKIVNQLKGGKLIGIVNCVGTAHFSKYADTTDKTISSIHNVNINSLHFLLRLNNILKVKQVTDDNQFFINVSSVTARQPFKYSIVYAATKGYISNLIQGVQQEQPQIVYLDVQPWFVKTKMIAYQQSWDCVGPQQIAEGSLSVLGHRSVCSGCWKHEIIDEFSWLWNNQLHKRLQQKMDKVIRIRQLQSQRRKRKD